MYLENLVFDAVDPGGLGRFWQAALGGEQLTDDEGGFETHLEVEGGPELDLCFQPVPEAPSEPQRLHLDLTGGADQGAVVERLLALGAHHVDIGQGDAPWVVLADPEGNPFCVMEERASYAGAGPIAALPLDSADPDHDLAFWAWLTGWTDVSAAGSRALRHPSLLGPLLELCPEPTPKGTAKNRLHLDIRLETGDDPAELAARVVELGGAPFVNPGWGELPWRSYTDRSGNEFCLLPARQS